MEDQEEEKPYCDLEVDVNGEQVFYVNKKIITSFSGKLSKLFGKSPAGNAATRLKVIFHDFPGGAKGFELMARFCYNNGRADITPANAVVLHCIARFMEMTKDASGSINLIDQTETSLKEIGYWSWSELLVALKQCQSFAAPVEYSSLGLVDKLLSSLVGRLVSSVDESPSTSSSESGFRRSCDTVSTESIKNCCLRLNWWFEDLSVLSPELLEKAVGLMVSGKLDNGIISRFLLYYQKSRFSGATSDEKCKTIETVINLLYSLDPSFIPYKSLFGILRATLGLSTSKNCRNKLEGMIGSQLDQATMDNLLVPSPPGVNFLYDVNLVIRLLKSFLLGGVSWVSLTRLKKVAKIIDLYIAEVSPDPCLKPSKFIALVMSLPDSARESYDDIYRSMDMYLEVHAGLSEEEKTMICSLLNYEKLSMEVCKHLAENPKFPARSAIHALSSQHSKLKNLLHDTSHQLYSSELTSPRENDHKKEVDQIVLYAKKLDLSTENDKLKENLQGMQWRVAELEKVCRKMQTQMAKIIKSRVSTSPGNPRSLPRMCS